MVPNVLGIVVAYDAMTGVVLLKFKPFRSLEDAAGRYVDSKNDQGFWLAKFMWSAVDPRDKDKIQASLGGRLVRVIILGCPVVCQLEKKPKWHVEHMRIILDEQRFALAKRRWKPENGQRNEQPKKRGGLTKFARSKLDGKGRGIVLTPVRGRKPGSHRS